MRLRPRPGARFTAKDRSNNAPAPVRTGPDSADPGNCQTTEKRRCRSFTGLAFRPVRLALRDGKGRPNHARGRVLRRDSAFPIRRGGRQHREPERAGRGYRWWLGPVVAVCIRDSNRLRGVGSHGGAVLQS
jgi:hypothetical protein